MSTATHGHMHKDEFLPTDRETMNAKIIRVEKARKAPDPGTYKDFPKLSTLLREISWSHNLAIFSPAGVNRNKFKR